MTGAIVYERGKSLYLNITNRCTNACRFCIRFFDNGVFGYDLMLVREPSYDDVVRELEVRLGRYSEYVFTGLGEPTIRLDDLLKITKYLHSKGERVRLDTNGHACLYHNDRRKDVIPMLEDAGLSAVSISLNAETKEKYDWLCKPIFDDAYEGTKAFARECSRRFDTQMTALTIEGIDLVECKNIANSLGASFRIRQYYGPGISLPDELR